MTGQDLRKVVIDALASVAPELDEATLAPDKNLRDQLDINSMDFLNFVIAVHEALNVDIPESDYRHILSIDDAVAYLSAKLELMKK